MRGRGMATFWRNLAPAARSLSRLPLQCSWACSGFRREQTFVPAKPHVDFDIENDSDELMVGIAITNAGPGPAAIKAVTYYVDRKPVAEADEWGERAPSCRRPNSITKSWSRVTRWRSGRRYGCHRRPPAAWGGEQESDSGCYDKRRFQSTFDVSSSVTCC